MPPVPTVPPVRGGRRTRSLSRRLFAGGLEEVHGLSAAERQRSSHPEPTEFIHKRSKLQVFGDHGGWFNPHGGGAMKHQEWSILYIYIYIYVICLHLSVESDEKKHGKTRSSPLSNTCKESTLRDISAGNMPSQHSSKTIVEHLSLLPPSRRLPHHLFNFKGCQMFGFSTVHSTWSVLQDLSNSKLMSCGISSGPDLLSSS